MFFCRPLWIFSYSPGWSYPRVCGSSSVYGRGVSALWGSPPPRTVNCSPCYIPSRWWYRRRQCRSDSLGRPRGLDRLHMQRKKRTVHVNACVDWDGPDGSIFLCCTVYIIYICVYSNPSSIAIEFHIKKRLLASVMQTSGRNYSGNDIYKIIKSKREKKNLKQMTVVCFVS